MIDVKGLVVALKVVSIDVNEHVERKMPTPLRMVTAP